MGKSNSLLVDTACRVTLGDGNWQYWHYYLLLMVPLMVMLAWDKSVRALYFSSVFICLISMSTVILLYLKEREAWSDTNIV